MYQIKSKNFAHGHKVLDLNLHAVAIGLNLDRVAVSTVLHRVVFVCMEDFSDHLHAEGVL